MKKLILLTLCAGLMVATPSFAATITGVMKYQGEVPKLKPIKMDADPICLTHHTGDVLPQSIVLGDGNTLGNVFVYVKSGLANKTYPAPTEPVIISQQGCMYTPHVTGVMVGQTLKILNPDGTLHNVHALCKVNTEFNLAMPKFRAETTKIFDKAEFMFPIKCDVHPWMGGWVSVMPHPFYATTDATGKFEIKNLPAGTYQIEAWHEKLGTQTASVTVGESDTKDVSLTFSRPQSASAK